VALALAAASCDVMRPPARFAVGDTIRLGDLQLAVTGWEPVPAEHGPVPALDAEPGRQAIAVFAHCTGLSGFEELDRYRFMETFLESRTELRGSWRRKYRPVNALPRDLYDSQPRVGPCADWTIVFHPAEGTECFELRINHPDPDGANFRAATVSLCPGDRSQIDRNRR
jgi:hypothetical protein